MQYLMEAGYSMVASALQSETGLTSAATAGQFALLPLFFSHHAFWYRFFLVAPPLTECVLWRPYGGSVLLRGMNADST